MLADSYNRFHNYLRISLTDKCNLRCFYCMPHDHYDFMPSAKLMQANEIESLAKTFVTLGVNKIRLTGGEPLVRKDVGEIIHLLSLLPVSLSLTTNGIRLHHFLPQILDVGIRSINISLDTLKADRYSRITRFNEFERVRTNIDAALNAGLHVKINMVVMKDVNDGELNDFVAWTRHSPVHVRFIEFMPFDGNAWQSNNLVSLTQILNTIESNYRVIKLKDDLHDTTKKYTVPGHLGTFAIISSMTDHFCNSCNRLRLTADGKLKSCLFSKTETDLLAPLRLGIDVSNLIKTNVLGKYASHGGQFTKDVLTMDATNIANRSMIAIGG